MKKLIAMLLALVMVLGLVACAAKTETPAAETPAAETPAEETPAAETPAAEEPAKEEEPAPVEGAVRTDEIATDVGTILEGEDAVKEGLIDEIGGLSQAIDALHSMIAGQNGKSDT